MPPRKPMTPREALEYLEKRKESMRIANAAARMRDAAEGLRFVQVKVPADAASLVREIAKSLVGKPKDRAAAAEALAKYRPKPRKQIDLLAEDPS